MQKKKICYNDSFGNDNSLIKQNLLKFVALAGSDAEFRTVDNGKDIIIINSEGWTFEYCPDIRQTNDFDCGVHVLMSADYLSDDIPINQLPVDRTSMENYRKFILWLIVVNQGFMTY